MYAKNSVWTMKTTIITDDEADRSAEVSSWEEDSDEAAALEAVASAAEVSEVEASEAEVPEANSNLKHRHFLVPTIVGSIVDHRQQHCRPSSAALPTMVGTQIRSAIINFMVRK